jgi:hypothetical protein
MWVDGYLIQFTNYNPTNSSQTNGNWWVGPWGTQFYGETHDYGDDMPGASSAKASFTSVSYQPNPSPTGASQPEYSSVTTHVGTGPCFNGYHLEDVTPTAFNIWTAGC